MNIAVDFVLSPSARLPDCPFRLCTLRAPSEEISSEKKRHAARKALYGSKSSSSGKGKDVSGKPPLNPNNDNPRGRGGPREQRRTSAFVSYLRREGVSGRLTLPDSLPEGREGQGEGQGERHGEGHGEGEARIAPPRAGLSRKRRASGREGEEAEDKRAGEDGARRLGHHERGSDMGKPGEAFSPRSGVLDSSEEESMTIPGLSGVLMTQLTWGADAWDAAQSRAGDRDSNRETAAADSHGNIDGIVDLDRDDSDTAGSGAGAEGSGVTAADVLEGRREDGASGDEVGGGRRLTFTEVCVWGRINQNTVMFVCQAETRHRRLWHWADHDCWRISQKIIDLRVCWNPVRERHARSVQVILCVGVKIPVEDCVFMKCSCWNPTKSDFAVVALA